MTTPLTAMSLEECAMRCAELKMRWCFTGRQDGESEYDAILAELRRRDALAASNAGRERRLVEAARLALARIQSDIDGVMGACAESFALRAAIAAYQEKTDG